MSGKDEDDRVWRLALHRMDLRQYTVTEKNAEAPTDAQSKDAGESGLQRVLLTLNAPEPDIQEMVDESASQFQAMNPEVDPIV